MVHRLTPLIADRKVMMSCVRKAMGSRIKTFSYPEKCWRQLSPKVDGPCLYICTCVGFFVDHLIPFSRILNCFIVE